ncbi:Zinc finger, TTF-type [Corchorus olitorius]|uniref:Zinc finger, TTF-type n=1 Tax=Corchorus olitorius TaxID=93759 RepID=A0A1R3I5B3_9ROSI|nr:Zinc finger, TTF-type [Corchorus olitorius]
MALVSNFGLTVGWEHKLAQVLPWTKVREICAIPLSNLAHRGNIKSWVGKSSGQFTSRPAYKLSILDKMEDSTVNFAWLWKVPSIERDIWRCWEGKVLDVASFYSVDLCEWLRQISDHPSKIWHSARFFAKEGQSSLGAKSGGRSGVLVKWKTPDKVNDSQTTESSDVHAPNIEQSPPDEQPPAISPNLVQDSSSNPKYSPTKDYAYCLPCYLFTDKPSERPRANAFIFEEFRNWKKIGGNECAFLAHVGSDPSSPHNKTVRCYDDFKNHSQHIDKLMEKQTSQEIAKNRLRLKTSIDAVRCTKALIRNLRDHGWETLLDTVKTFCGNYDIEAPNMDSLFSKSRARSRLQKNSVTMEHHYKVDVFFATIDRQLNELNSRFNEQAVQLLTLSSALDPRDGFKLFETNAVCSLVEKFYPSDFTEQEKILLKYELQHYGLSMPKHLDMQNLSTVAELCRK